MDKPGILDVIQFAFLEGEKTLRLGDLCPSCETVILWVNEFKWGRTSIEVAPPPETPEYAVILESIDKVYHMVLVYR